MKKNGFTLVELSIVLVIIGLLIGGILVGQTLIDSTKLSGVVRDLSRYQSVIYAFRSKYKQLPGDSILFVPIGDNNGIIDNGEVGETWYHLSLGLELKNSKGTNYKSQTINGSNITDKTYYPILNINQRTEAPGATRMTPGLRITRLNSSAKKVALQYRIAYNNQMGNGQRFDPLLSTDTAALDIKLDDGKPLTGEMLTYSSTDSPALCTLDGLNYNTAYTADYICSFVWEFLPQP